MKNLIQTTALAVLLSTLTGCGLYDTANQRSQLMGNLHEGMTTTRHTGEAKRPSSLWISKTIKSSHSILTTVPSLR